MGRGRAKAKQTKVARELKYNSGGTDLDRLRQELAGAPGAGVGRDDTDDVDEADDDYGDPYAEDDGEDDEADDDEPGHRSA